MLRLNKLLLNDGDLRAFDGQIEPTETQRKFLSDCKNKIRDHLRAGITQASVEILGVERQVSPRFRTQGSWTYRTCVQRAHAQQEMDWDFGVYLPVNVFADQTPRIAARAYFDLVEGLLESLCREEQWQIDNSRDSCIRVRVAKWAHIDVPLYAAPESEFESILERTVALAKASSSYRDAQYLNESVLAGELVELGWEDLQGIHLAQRDGTWKKSDPEAVARWYNDRLRELGEMGSQMRRICRYIKAWRDFWWPHDGPSSVALMIATAQGFQSKNFRRDDLALEQAALHLASALLEPLLEPSISDGAEDFFENLSTQERQEASQRASELAAGIALARNYAYHRRHDAVEKMRSLLGVRIPQLFDWIETDGTEADVRATPASRVPPPLIKPTKAG